MLRYHILYQAINSESPIEKLLDKKFEFGTIELDELKTLVAKHKAYMKAIVAIGFVFVWEHEGFMDMS